MRAKDKEFQCKIKTDFDESIGKINVVSLRQVNILMLFVMVMTTSFIRTLLEKLY